MTMHDDDLARTADRLTDAFGAAAAVMELAAGSSDAASAVPARRGPRSWGGRASGWLVPLTVAAGVAAIVLASVFAVAALKRPGAHQGPPGDTSTSGGPPPFYVTEVQAKGASSLANVIQVHRTSDGAVTGTVTAPAGWILSGPVSAAADREFFAAAARPDCQASRILRFTLTASGQVASSQLAGPTIKGWLASMSAAPGGSQVAFDGDSGGPSCSAYDFGQPSVDVLSIGFSVSVLDLPSGTIKTWTQADQSTGADVYAAPLSWAADGRLVLNYKLPGSGGADGQFQIGQMGLEVLALNTATTGGSIQAASRVLWSTHSGPCHDYCITEGVFAGPGDTLFVPAMPLHPSSDETSLVLRIAVPQRAGAAAAVLYAGAPGRVGWYGIFPDSSGRYLLAGINGKLGWISGGKLIPLQAEPRLSWIAW
jgi:hypothetical protein